MFHNLKNIVFSLVCCLFLLSYSLWGQKSHLKYDFVSIKESISKAAVSNIIQDHYGFIWMGTIGAGLYRYDGIDYYYYKHNLNDTTSISSNLITCTYLDKNNRLWVGTEKGLSLYERKKDQFKRISFLDYSQSNVSILSLKGDNNSLFIGTIAAGLFKLNLETFKVEKIFNDITKNSISTQMAAIEIDKNETIYVGTRQGLKKVNSKTNTLDQAIFATNQAMFSVKEQIQSLLIDEKQNIWIGTVSNGLFKIKASDGVDELSEVNHFLISENKFLSMIALSDGTIMCGTENDGLFHIDVNGKIIKNYTSNKTDEKSIASNSIWSLFLDSNERIWLGYFNKGVAVYDKLHDKFNHIESLNNNRNSLQIGSVTAISQDNSGKFWIGMDGGGIDLFDTKSNKFTHINSSNKKAFSGLTNDYILALFIDSKENVWAGSWNKGLFFLKKGTNKFINYTSENTNGNLSSNTVLSFAEDASGTIWIGSFYGGLHSYNPDREEFKNHNSGPFLTSGILRSNIRQLIVNHNDDLCVATNLGVFKVKELSNNTFSVTSMANIMAEKHRGYTPATHIQSLYESTDHSLWIGTRGAGICKYNSSKDTYTWYNKLNGLDQENVNGIIESLDGNIWISGNYGISKLNIKTNTITNFTTNDGLLSNDFNINASYRDDKGNLYLGNYQGIDFFNPENIELNNNLPSLYLTDFKLFNEKVLSNQKNSPLQKVISETDSISLNSKQSVFTIEYSGINYTRPEKIEYAYYMEGYETSWNYVGKKRSATYTNLDPGDYTFMLKAANNDGFWNETPLKLNITILPPWWKTSWAIMGYILLFLFGIYLLNKITQARIKEKQTINNERDKRVQEKGLNEKKFQFFTNISHEFRTPLTLIMNPIEDIIQNDALNLPQRVKEKHNVIYKNTNRLYRLINELLDFRKLELDKVRIKAKELNLVDFTKDIVGYFKEEALVNNILLSVDTDINDILVWADENMLEKIIFNILSNAFKVTPEGGSVTVDISLKDDEVILPLIDENKTVKVVKIVISDTGPGLEKEQVKRIFERFYQVENLNKTYYGGTGIGLEVVQNFVHLHKGEVTLDSEVGKGTAFKIRLPLGNEHFNENEIVSSKTEVNVQKERFLTTNPSDETKSTEETNADALTHTLLIVEDNTELRNYLKDELKNQYKILTAKNGAEGFNTAKDFLPDIIITDVIMPKMDGFVFCKHIKSDITTSHIPLLMLTAKARIENRMEGIEIGADAYMVKPFDMRLLKLRLSQLITSRQLIFNKYFSVISDVPNNTNTTSLDKQFIQKVLNYINDNIGDPDLNVELLASQLNLSRSQFYRKIKALTNQTANEFLRNIRLQKAKQIIETGNSNISEVCYKVGFSSPSYFTKCFKSYFDLLPTEVKINQ